MPAFDALGRLAITQPPHTPALPTFLDPCGTDPATFFRRGREAGWGLYQQVGLPIKPAQLTPVYVEQALKFKPRINDPQPQIVVGLPITPWDKLTPNYIEQAIKPSVRLPPDLPTYQIVNQQITPAPFTPLVIEHVGKRRGDVSAQPYPMIRAPVSFALGFAGAEIVRRRDYQDAAVPQVISTTPASTTLAPDILEQAQRPPFRVNDWPPYQVVNQPITPAAIRPAFVQDMHKPRTRVAETGLTFYGIIAKTPSVLTPLVYDASLKRHRNVEYQGDVFRFAGSATPVNLTTVYVEQGLKPAYRIPDQNGPLFPIVTRTPAALTPTYVEQGLKFTYRVNDPQPYLQVGQPITPAGLAPTYVEQAQRFKVRATDWPPMMVVNLPITPAPLAAVIVEQVKFKYRSADWTMVPTAPPSAIAPLPLPGIDLRPPTRHADTQALSIRPIFSTFLIRSLDEVGLRRRADTGAGLPFAPPVAAAAVPSVVEWSEYANGRRRGDAFSLGGVLRPTTQVVRLLLTRTLTGAGV